MTEMNNRVPDSPNRFVPLIAPEVMHEWGIRRHNASLSRADLGKILGYSLSQVRRWERGESCIPDSIANGYMSAIEEAEEKRRNERRVAEERRYKRAA